jgi:hypothetical protein
VRAAAQLAGKTTDRYDAHRFPVFLFEQGGSALPYGVFAAFYINYYGDAVHYLLIDHIFDFPDLFILHCFEMGEVETHPAGFDKGP